LVRARRLKHKITIQNVTETQDSYGQPKESWATYAVRDAEIIPATGNEYYTSQQIYSEKTIRFRLRYDNTVRQVTPKMRISYDSRTFDIESVINVKELNRDIDIICTEHNA
jgi:SPP1 family predicted phage head-tail adaptor